ncbi:MAG: TRAP transporter large permease [Armatimonadota bacterium]
MIAVLFLFVVLFLILGVPISVTMVLACVAAILGFTGYSLEVIVHKLYFQTNTFPLLAIPLFVMAGNVMSRGGMSERLINLARSMVGNVRGGIAMVSVVACMLFASVSGSTAATTAAIGMVLIPAMVRSGFSTASAASLQSTAGSIGIIIPPSIPMILMGVIGGLSIGKLFLGGIIPGILIGLSLMLTAHLIARVQKHQPSGETFKLKEFILVLKDSLLSLLTVVFVVGAIMKGIVTPTEAAIIAVLWSIFVCLFIYREITIKDFAPVLVDTVKITGIVVLCIGATAPFAWLLTVEQFQVVVSETMLAITSNPIFLKLLMLAIMIALGTFLDLTPAMIILIPILFPIAKHIGMDLNHFGVVMVAALAVGQSTPPVGIALFVACSISKIKIGDVVIPMIPFLIAMLLSIILILFVPELVVWIPNTFMK